MVSKMKIKKAIVKPNSKTEQIEITLTLESAFLDENQINDLVAYVDKEVEIHTKG
jgi:hypothetical protein